LYEETLVILKPDALERCLVGSIIKRYEDVGLKVLDIRFVADVGESLIEQHYPSSMARSLGEKAQKAIKGIADPEAHGKLVLERLRKYLTRGPVIAIRIGGEDAIRVVRRVTGYTDPATAERGTIRGDYGADSLLKSTEEGRACENLVHASGDAEEAKRELDLWFPKKRHPLS
jgi:nucleoside-diphosphate kinase